ncbi:permease of an ABC exporter involved in polysaccharide export [Bordetella trematum]|uniref:ABC transporter permease n=1 Tax=Bordetella trematum TaxID=123899 RepID=UPI0007983442|nr:ABC transporter permease [Bordetella trematum]SAI28677.1 permease of an ABC exporter involved in polysaccharide export [Bordetella trematum]
MMLERRSFEIMKAVIFALVLREVRGKFGVHRLAGFWFVVEPLAHVCILLVVFMAIRQRMVPGVEFALFLVNGIIPFILFKNITLKGMEAVNANRGLFSYRQIKPFDMVLARLIVEFSLMACVYVLTLFALWWFFDYSVSIVKPLQWFCMLMIGVTLSFGLALIYCVLINLVPEAATLIRLMYLPLYFITGVIFPIWMIPAKYMEFLLWNPYLHIIDMMRAYSMDHYPVSLQVNWEYPATVSLVTLVVGLFVYRAKRLEIVAA